MTLHVFDPAFLVPSVIRRSPMRAVYAGEAIRHFGVGLFAIFEPVYLYIVFRDAHFVHPVAWVLLFYAAFYALFGVLAVVATRFIPRYGFRFLTLVSLLFFFLYFVALFLAREALWWVLLALVLLAIRAALFWPPFHLFFARSSQPKHRGAALGNIAVLTALASAASPAIGGTILAEAGYPALFFVVLVILLLSAVPYLAVDIREGHRGGFGPVLREVRSHGGFRGALAFAGQGIEDSATAHVWPLFLFLLALGYQELGFLTTVALLVSLAITLFVGRLADHRNRIQMLVLAAPLAGLAWIFRVATLSSFTALVANVATSITRPFVLIPFNALFYDRVSEAQAGEPMHLILFRELSLGVGRIVFFIGGAAVVWFTGDLRWLLLVPILAMFAMAFLKSWAPFVPIEESPEANAKSGEMVG
ncbi:MAG: hypothetical protein A2991_03270 [Candidatus Terrybacteria bacterium RIFCSPLOWO2_01_FULL_58_14]|uniref:Major facilitator superfamily (MFS) profile domain-containing protein n=2 Tax=Candidatus Terryibacteriota TaxID=1817920 RepID=A0A1G2PVQ7_9BACT|nr:MAG: hypothetical protein A2682_02420 [Candidatus Terrybacteria bacterium RIFCSPHIGHO2_01_FULL_58_15]OHA52410.1 MAG: hypothetical protein A2991_03270 [Candidatus Terrybacteria bacterium RIFCSPLOWO2_01_FULL_58_14]